ncbi:MAG: DUF4249 domain-containing protein, partial [Bacteroidaceae bacterium]|nr:DUF4249 domain-containing protein [Bacteroidaceae bacterium]
MRRICHITLLALALILGACERTLDFNGPENEKETDLIINATAVAGTPLTVYLSRAYQIDKVPSVRYYDYEHAVLFRDDLATDYLTDDYLRKTVVKDGELTVEVNGTESYPMYFNDLAFSYESQYVPQEGDRIRVVAVSGEKELWAETVVPAKPHIEITDNKILAENPYQDMEGLINQSDTIMRLICRITDSGGQNYYRLRLRSERSVVQKSSSAWWQDGEAKARYYHYYVMQDIFFSNDEMFTDNRLTQGFGGWPAYFSDVFEGASATGRTFTIDSPKAYIAPSALNLKNTSLEEIPEIAPRVMVELQAISYDLYKYLKAMQLFRVTGNDKNAEPILIPSNIENGWGILGALS